MSQNCWMKPNGSSYHLYVAPGHVFVAFETKKGWCGAHVQNHQWNEFEKEFLSEKDNIVGLGVKVIGSGALYTRVCQLLKGHSVKIAKSSERKEQLEIFFRSSNGQIRIRKTDSPQKTEKIRLFIVDDSSTIRKLLRKTLQEEGDIEIVGESGNPIEALKELEVVKPDVITLDIHMPEMNGVEMLKAYHKKTPIPTVMVTSIRMEEGPLVMEALSHGAIDYIEKPSMSQLTEAGRDMRERIRVAARSQFQKIHTRSVVKPANIDTDYDLIAFGASTGGTEALKQVISGLPKELPPVVIVQHMPPVFTKAFAERLNAESALTVKEAEDGDVLQVGHVYIAPGGLQTRVVDQGGLKLAVTPDPPVNRHAPSVDVMYQSIVDLKSQPTTIALLMTGMGADGAEGLLQLKNKSVFTVVQSEETCTVWGMPRVAFNLEAHEEVWHLQDFPQKIVDQIHRPAGKRAS